MSREVEEHWTSELPIVVTIHNFCPDGIQIRKTIGKLVTGSGSPGNRYLDISPQTLHTRFILFCFASSWPVSSSSRSVDRAAPVPCPAPRLGPGSQAVSRDQRNSEMIQEMFLEDKEWRKERNNVSVEFYMTSRMCLHSFLSGSYSWSSQPVCPPVTLQDSSTLHSWLLSSWRPEVKSKCLSLINI